MASNSSRRTAGPLNTLEGLQIPPSSATDLTTKDTVIYQLVVANTTGSSATLTINDKQGSPLSLLSAVSFAANGTTVLNFNEGVRMLGGVRWSQGTANALNVELFAFVHS
jgi:hypothetical protein